MERGARPRVHSVVDRSDALSRASESPDCPPPRKLASYAKPLREPDAWWLMLFYLVTFGGFSGLASSLSIYFVDNYGLTPVQAGYAGAACVFFGSLVRPFGGALADRLGGSKTLTTVYGVSAAALAAIGTSPASVTFALGLFIVAMLALGIGNGAVFQLVPQRFGKEIGVMTGLVGCAEASAGSCSPHRWVLPGSGSAPRRRVS
jgi:NNP family nitrate/nitrite transporter-like MFS transporter